MRPAARLNLNSRAWRRLREVYADQPIASVPDLQARLLGVWLAGLERMAYGATNSTVAPPEVIFIIGHWRSGTTFLHELLCRSPAFNFPSTYACMNPQVFPLTEAAVLQRAGQKSMARPMDDMPVSLASPQEDEFALLALGARSPYEGLLFPGALDRGMAAADPEDLPAADQQEWILVFSRFLGQVAARKPGLPVVLKSPTHGYRVKLLARLHPGARFIHIVRNPYEVYRSTVNMWQKLCALYTLGGRPDAGALARQVIANWVRLEEKLDAALPGLRKGHYVRVRYEDLAVQPVQETEKIYGSLSLAGFADALPHLTKYLAARAPWVKSGAGLAPESEPEVYRAWRHIFDKYGYPEATSPA